MLPAACLIAGILLERAGYGIVGAGGCLLVAIFARCRRQAAVLCAVALAVGVIDGALRGHPASIERASARGDWSGTVVGDVRASSVGTFTFPFAIDHGVTVRATVFERVDPGDRLRLHGRLEPIDTPRNPREPSLREFAADDGIAAALPHASVVAREAASASDTRASMPRARAAASRALRLHLAEPYASILAGAMWGERTQLPASLRAEFQDTGTVHVLVTAGLHLGVIAALALAMFSWSGMFRAPAAISTMAVVWAYTWFSGAHLPSLRAAAMVSIALLARACGARAISWNTFAVAWIVVGAAWPAAVGSASFALSFSCVGAIFVFAKPISAALEQVRIVPSGGREALALTLATQIGVWPLTAAVFLLIAPYAPIANLGVVPVVGIAMVFGFAQLAATPLPDMAAAIAALNTWLLAWIVAVVKTVAALPGARVDVSPPSVLQIGAYDALVVFAAGAFRTHRFRTGIVAAFFAIGVVAVRNDTPHGALTITALDVGQADAIVITTPRGHAFMIDAGGKLERGTTADGDSPAEDVGERVVVPYLLRNGITSIDGIIMTHPHGDHVGGVAPVLRHLHVGWLADSGQVYGGHAYHDALAEASRRNVELREPRAGDVWTTDDGVNLRFLAPSAPYFTDGKNDVNENSIVVMLEYGRFRALLMGDAGAQSEQRLIASATALRADLLKVGHHGSAYSSTATFIRAVSPAVAIISVGRHNLFGHPAPSTLTTLAAVRSQVYRTDGCGAITVRVTDTVTTTPMLACTQREHPAVARLGDPR